MCQFLNIWGLKIGTFPLFSGAGLLAIAFLVAYQIKYFKLDNESETKVMICIPLSVLFGCITGYFSDVIFRGGIKAILQPWGYGMTFYGWLTGCVLFFLIYSKMLHISVMFLLNCFLPGFTLAQSLGRIGCFCGGCCFGKPVDFLGVCYPQGSLAYAIYKDTPLVPVQLLESIYLLTIFIILFFYIKFKYRTACYFILVPFGRFLFEFLRGDNRGSVGLHLLSPAQCISIILFCNGIFLFCYYRIKSKRYYG